jgi:hypothetical protein
MPNYNKKIEVSCPNCGVVRLARTDVVKKALKERNEFWCLPCRNKTRVHKPRKYIGTKEERRRQAVKSWQDNNRDKVLDQRYKRRYGISYAEYKTMLSKQKNKCLICNTEDMLVVDHNHKTSEVRGLLCHSCNCAIGLFRDDPSMLQSAITYLKS